MKKLLLVFLCMLFVTPLASANFYAYDYDDIEGDVDGGIELNTTYFIDDTYFRIDDDKEKPIIIDFYFEQDNSQSLAYQGVFKTGLEETNISVYNWTSEEYDYLYTQENTGLESVEGVIDITNSSDYRGVDGDVESSTIIRFEKEGGATEDDYILIDFLVMDGFDIVSDNSLGNDSIGKDLTLDTTAQVLILVLITIVTLYIGMYASSVFASFMFLLLALLVIFTNSYFILFLFYLLLAGLFMDKD